jgi:hypothetical protein
MVSTEDVQQALDYLQKFSIEVKSTPEGLCYIAKVNFCLFFFVRFEAREILDMIHEKKKELSSSRKTQTL